MWSAVMGLSLVPCVSQYVQDGFFANRSLRLCLYSWLYPRCVGVLRCGRVTHAGVCAGQYDFVVSVPHVRHG
jgi:hypothetical protein